MKITEGPWQTVSTPNHDQGRKFIVWGPKGPGYGAVAHTTPFGWPYSEEARDECEANATLLSAAPELLDVAQKALIWFEAFQPSFPPSTAVGSTIEGTIEILRTAIAKAKGK